MKKKKTNYAYQGMTDGAKPEAAPMSPADVQKDYLNILYYQAKQRNNLLGEFSSDGKYAIKDEKILQELVLLPKKFDEKKDNVVYASTKIEDEIVLNFKLEFEMSESFCRGVLSIIETEQNVQENIKHVTKLDEYKDIYSPKFKEDMYKRWKVYFDEEVYDKNDYIYSILHMQHEEYLFNKELTEILSQLYMVRLLKLLDNSGEVGEKIKAEYKFLVEKLMQQDPSIMQDNTRLKLVLDSIIIKNKALATLMQTKEGTEIFAGYSAPIKRMKDKTTEVVLNVGGAERKKEDKTIDTKTAAKKGGAKKKDKSAGGGGEKPFVFDFAKGFKAAKYGGAPTFKFTPVKKAEVKTVQNTTDQANLKGPAPTNNESEELSKLLDLASKVGFDNYNNKVEQKKKGTSLSLNMDDGSENGEEKFEKNDPTKNKFENNKENERIKIG